MKKVILSLVLLIIVFMAQPVYAATSCNITIETDKTKYNKDETIIANVKISNIQSSAGVIAVGAKLEYDKNSLTLESMVGQNGWSNPSYNEDNGLFVMDRSDLTKNDEIIMKMTFKVISDSSTASSIALKEVTAGDGGTTFISVASTTKDVALNGAEVTNPTNPTDPSNPTPTNPTNPTDPTNPNPGNTQPGNTTVNNTVTPGQNENKTPIKPSNTVNNVPVVNNATVIKPDNTTSTDNFPNTGENIKAGVLIVIGVSLLFVVYFSFKMKVKRK